MVPYTSHDIFENDDSQVDASEKQSDLYQVLELEKPIIDKPAKKLRENFLNSLSDQSHERQKPLIPTPSFRVVKSENFSSENDISANNDSEDETRIIMVIRIRVVKFLIRKIFA